MKSNYKKKNLPIYLLNEIYELYQMDTCPIGFRGAVLHISLDEFEFGSSE